MAHQNNGRPLPKYSFLLSFALLPFYFPFSCPYYYPSSIGPFPENQLHLYNNDYIGNSKRTESEAEYFDLTYTLDNTTLFYPGQRFDFELYPDVGPTRNRTTVGNYEYSYASWSFCMGEHGGTHIDAPFHFNRFGWRLNEIPLKRLVDIPAVVIDVERHVFSRKYPDQFLLKVEHIKEHEASYGPISHGALAIVHFGWGRFWNDRLRYSGWNNRTAGEEPTLDFPGISGQAANWLLKERHIVGLGTDTMSPDIGNNGGNLPAHILLLENQVYILENVGNLDYMLQKIKSKSYPGGCNLRMFVMPIKTEGTGGPVRLVAYCKN